MIRQISIRFILILLSKEENRFMTRIKLINVNIPAKKMSADMIVIDNNNDDDDDDHEKRVDI